MSTTANTTSSDSIGMDFDYTSAFRAASLVVAQCPSWAVAIGYLGVSFAMILSNFGSAVSNMLIILFEESRTGALHCFTAIFFIANIILLSLTRWGNN